MVSSLELRHIIESGFLPLVCQCTVSPDTSLTVVITDPDTRRPTLTVTGINSQKLVDTQAISKLVVGLKQDFGAIQEQILKK